LLAGRPSKWIAAMHSVTPGLEKPCTGASPAFHTRPFPSARLRAYCMEIMPSSQSVKKRWSASKKLVLKM